MENQFITNINQLDLNKVYTYAEYLTWQIDERLELLRGFIAKMSAPSRKHQTCSRRILRSLFAHFNEKSCEVFHAPFDVRLPIKKLNKKNEEVSTVVQPDICVICDAEKLDDKGCIGAPDWIIEIVSPNNSRTDFRDKFEIYQEAGVKEYWIAMTNDFVIQQFFLENGKYQLKNMFVKGDIAAPILFPELLISVDEIFEE